MRLCDIDTLIEKYGDWYIEECTEEGYIGCLETLLSDEPTIDAEPVRHGTLLGVEYDGYADGVPVYDVWECSVCGCKFDGEDVDYNYCPTCGAKMDGGDADD